MFDLLPSPWEDAFDALLDGCRTSLVLTSPYIGRRPCDRVIARLRSRRPPINLLILTDLSADNLLSGATDSAALLDVIEALPVAELRFLPRLHAKVYIGDCGQAIVTSGNMTTGGLRLNYEYGVRIIAAEPVARIREDILGLAGLGSPVSVDQLRTMNAAAVELRAARTRSEASLRADLRRQFESRLAELNEDLLRVRVGTRSIDAVFSETILFILRRGPRATTEIHQEVQRIHPDLCDDTIDRVINGQHYGKKWKHAVRTAQFHLKKKGLVERRDGRWQRVGSGSSQSR